MFLSYTITGTLRSTALHKKDVAHTAAGMFSLLRWVWGRGRQPCGYVCHPGGYLAHNESSWRVLCGICSRISGTGIDLFSLSRNFCQWKVSLHRTAPSALLLAVLRAWSHGWAAKCIALLSQRLRLYLERGSADCFLSASLVVGHAEGSSCIQPVLNYNRNSIFFPHLFQKIYSNWNGTIWNC